MNVKMKGTLLTLKTVTSSIDVSTMEGVDIRGTTLIVLKDLSSMRNIVSATGHTTSEVHVVTLLEAVKEVRREEVMEDPREVPKEEAMKDLKGDLKEVQRDHYHLLLRNKDPDQQRVDKRQKDRNRALREVVIHLLHRKEGDHSQRKEGMKMKSNK